MVEEGATHVEPPDPTYPTLLMYSHESALLDDQLSVEPDPWLTGLGERETEQEAAGGSVQVMYTAPGDPSPPALLFGLDDDPPPPPPPTTTETPPPAASSPMENVRTTRPPAPPGLPHALDHPTHPYPKFVH